MEKINKWWKNLKSGKIGEERENSNIGGETTVNGIPRLQKNRKTILGRIVIKDNNYLK